MFYDRFQRVMRLALSAGWLIMALTPPAVRHAHSDGERQHKHPLGSNPLALGLAHPHAGSRTHAHRHSHLRPHLHTAAHVERQYSRGGVDHCHVAWLGFEFVMPAPTSHAPWQGDEDRMAQELVPVFAASDFAVGPQTAPAIAAAPLFTPTLPSIEGLPAETALWIAASGAISNRLCDTARHERSGVQLI